MRASICDRCISKDHKFIQATKVLSLRDKVKKVRGELCAPHAKEADRFYDKRTRKADLNGFESWLLGMEETPA